MPFHVTVTCLQKYRSWNRQVHRSCAAVHFFLAIMCIRWSCEGAHRGNTSWRKLLMLMLAAYVSISFDDAPSLLCWWSSCWYWCRVFPCSYGGSCCWLQYWLASYASFYWWGTGFKSKIFVISVTTVLFSGP